MMQMPSRSTKSMRRMIEKLFRDNTSKTCGRETERAMGLNGHNKKREVENRIKIASDICKLPFKKRISQGHLEPRDLNFRVQIRFILAYIANMTSTGGRFP